MQKVRSLSNESEQQKHDSNDENLEGLLRNLTNLFNEPGPNIREKYLRNFLTCNMSGQPTNYPSYIQNPGVAIEKSNFNTTKQKLLQKRKLFTDSDFPANKIELPDISRSIKWKRPSEFSKHQFFKKEASILDINQGILGDSWIISAKASLCLFPNMLQKIVPVDQSFNEGDYCGMFHFNIWYYGQWIEVLVDDLLPTADNQLVFIDSTHDNEFWSDLLEKAYAKVYGSYKNLRKGYKDEVMLDLSGGIIERIDILGSGIRKNSILANELFFQLMDAFNCFTMMSCSTTNGMEKKTSSGLSTSHAYAITGVYLVNINDTHQVQLVRLRNPWGNGNERLRPWSDGTIEWSRVPPQELQKLQLASQSDGEFWMEFSDLVKEFDRIKLCYNQSQAMEDASQMKNGNYSSNKSWESNIFYGDWKAGFNAGGSNRMESYWYNPQFMFHIPEPDPDSTDGTASVVIGLVQRDLRIVNKDLISMKYTIYQTAKPPDRLLFRFEMAQATFIDSSGSYRKLRDIGGRHKLKPGFYVIIPSTDEENTERQFLIRIFSFTKVKAEMLDQKLEIDDKINVNYPVFEVNDKRVRTLFEKHASSPGKLYFDGLKLAAMEEIDPKYGCFTSKTSKSVIFMFKNEYEESINETEFKTFLSYLYSMKYIFGIYVVNDEGKFNSMKLRSALSEIGIRLNNFLMEKIVGIYSRRNKITLDSYIRCCVQLQTINEHHRIPRLLPPNVTRTTLAEIVYLCLDTMTD